MTNDEKHEQRRAYVLRDRVTNDWWTRTALPLDKFCRDNAVLLDHCMQATAEDK